MLSFYKVFEIDFKEVGRREIGPKTQEWITAVFDEACKNVNSEMLQRFHADRQSIAVAKYIHKNCRVAAAHASKDYPSDADVSSETSRLSIAAQITNALARYYIRTKFSFSNSYLSDE